MLRLTNSLDDLVSLVFPQVCVVCGEGLHNHEEDVCTICLFKMPQTGFHKINDNPVAKLFWGRVEIHAASSLYYYQKGGSVQELIHELKYKAQKQVGTCIGKQYGYELKDAELYKNIDLIVPVPLHKSRLRKRGYNQSEYFAKGLSEVMNIPENSEALQRSALSGTQTRKSRFNRWKNVEMAFEVKNPPALKDKHILLVDDVVTTGATLEACAKTLLDSGAGKVSIATIAYTMT